MAPKRLTLITLLFLALDFNSVAAQFVPQQAFEDHPVSLLEQMESWTTADGRVTISFPESWTKMGADRVKEYSPTARTAIPSSRHRRRAGGLFPRRDLTAQVYMISAEPFTKEQFLQVVSGTDARLRKDYQIVDNYVLDLRGIYSISYRFQHSGQPVTQTDVFFQDRLGRVYLLEVTGHRKDEELLVGESRQLTHSIVLR